MKLLVIVLCLLSERFLIHSISNQRFVWFNAFYSKASCFFAQSSFLKKSWMKLVLILALISIPVAIFYWVFYSFLFGFLDLVLSSIIFLYCLGPQNVFYPAYNQSSPENYFFLANRQLFAVIFWYLVAGPVAILLYRVTTLCCNYTDISKVASQIVDILEWIPARLTVLLYLLVGNFQRGFTPVAELFLARPELNYQVLSVGGLQAAKTNESDEISLSIAENLVEKALVVCVVLIALFTLLA